MRAFTVSVNEVATCTAGVLGAGVCSVNLTWVDVTRWSRGHEVFWVGGLASRTREHVRWSTPGLAVGDRVSIAIVDVDVVDPATERYPEGAKGDSYALFLWRFYSRRARAELASLQASPRAWAAQVGSSLRQIPGDVRRWVRELAEPHPTMALRVSHNGRLVCTAGIGAPCVTSVHITRAMAAGEGAVERLSLDVGALDTRKREHMNWDTPELRVGDTVVVEIVATEQVDPPARRPSVK